MVQEKFNTFEVVRDCEILHFMKAGFGDEIDNDVDLQRKELVTNCDAKKKSYWVGRSIFRIMVNMGLVEDNMPYAKTKLTRRGELFLQQEQSSVN